eukprot:COSAG01_NODE_5229_length_4399_cov_36.514419_3_plen_399_part_00
MAADGAIAAGTVVKIGGLVSARERNGKLGLVEGFDAAKGRYVVRLAGEAVGTTITMNLKMSNVQPSTGVAALQFAASIGDIAAMGQLLDGGADPNALVALGVEDPTLPGQKMRMTALTTALGYKQDAAVQLLLERGADPSLAVSTGLTPLILAAIHGNVAAVQLLLAQKVALDCVCRLSGGTAFHYACSGGHADVVEALLRAGCDTTMRGKDDMTGRDQAIHAGHTAVVRAIDVAAAASGEAGGKRETARREPEPEARAASGAAKGVEIIQFMDKMPPAQLQAWAESLGYSSVAELKKHMQELDAQERAKGRRLILMAPEDMGTLDHVVAGQPQFAVPEFTDSAAAECAVEPQPEPEQSAAAELLAAGTAVEIAVLDPISLLLGWIRASRAAWARHHS